MSNNRAGYASMHVSKGGRTPTGIPKLASTAPKQKQGFKTSQSSGRDMGPPSPRNSMSLTSPRSQTKRKQMALKPGLVNNGMGFFSSLMDGTEGGQELGDIQTSPDAERRAQMMEHEDDEPVRDLPRKASLPDRTERSVRNDLTPPRNRSDVWGRSGSIGRRDETVADALTSPTDRSNSHSARDHPPSSTDFRNQSPALYDGEEEYAIKEAEVKFNQYQTVLKSLLETMNVQRDSFSKLILSLSSSLDLLFSRLSTTLSGEERRRRKEGVDSLLLFVSFPVIEETKAKIQEEKRKQEDLKRKLSQMKGIDGLSDDDHFDVNAPTKEKLDEMERQVLKKQRNLEELRREANKREEEKERLQQENETLREQLKRYSQRKQSSAPRGMDMARSKTTPVTEQQQHIHHANRQPPSAQPYPREPEDYRHFDTSPSSVSYEGYEEQKQQSRYAAPLRRNSKPHLSAQTERFEDGLERGQDSPMSDMNERQWRDEDHESRQDVYHYDETEETQDADDDENDPDFEYFEE
ncbi:hypothetical protein BLNAU_2939 [Blattamonas nauphoetae]|uniref:Uncharacterized protein n=1 Tax=Blattamonas nauphoetae TaxID=2049346 RepID=A0ABQ9YES5_9EUKA|nr:hypothetical protein BLNAU_2939 [Blattamonas nauphoetae]